MIYQGSKNKIAKYILPIMLEERKEGQAWVEPFVGGANLIDKVSGERFGNDSNIYLISLLKAVQNGWVPPTTVSKEDYYAIKSNPENYSTELYAFVAFLCSFGGKFWGGYASNKINTNYADTGSRVITKQAQNLSGIIFTATCYSKMLIPPNSLIYCDPPYQGKTGYKNKFNNKEFWEWARIMTVKGHTVFVSEYNAPDDFECIIEIDHKSVMNKNKPKKTKEKLFRYKNVLR
jgi:DNA adenine methylase